MHIKKIQVSEIKPEMVTGKDVLTNDGKILLTNGTELKEKHINVLKKRDITEIFIVTDDDEGSEAPLDDVREEKKPQKTDITKVIEKLDHIFSKVKDNEDMNNLFTLAVQKADHIKIDN